jgi:hypothetical protein
MILKEGQELPTSDFDQRRNLAILSDYHRQALED